MHGCGGSPASDIDKINSRVVCNENGISEKDIPEDAVYATSNNQDKAAINEGIFSLFVSKTHSKDKNIEIPMHTICMKASNILF